MIKSVTEEMHGSDRVPDLNTDYERALVGRAKATASTRAKWRSSECTEQYAQKVLDRDPHCQRGDVSPLETPPSGGGSDNFRFAD